MTDCDVDGYLDNKASRLDTYNKRAFRYSVLIAAWKMPMFVAWPYNVHVQYYTEAPVDDADCYIVTSNETTKAKQLAC